MNEATTTLTRAETHSAKNTEAETEAKNQGSAVPLHVKGYPLNLDALLS